MTPGAEEADGLLRRVGVGGASVLGIVLLVLAVPALAWQFGTPRLGFELEFPAPDRAVIDTVVPGGTAAAVGVTAGDTLLSVGGLEPSERVDLRDRSTVFRMDIINEYREGERADWVVIRGDERRALTGSFQGIPDHTPRSRAIVLAVFWLIAWFLLWARSDRKSVRHLAYTIFALTASVLFVLNQRMAVDTPLGFAVQQAHILGLSLGPPLVIHFGVVFPRPSLSDRVRRAVLAATYGLYFVAVFVVHEAVFVRALLRPEAPYLMAPPVLESLHYTDINVWLHVGDYLVCGQIGRAHV